MNAAMAGMLKPGDRVLVEAVVVGGPHGDRIGLRTFSAMKIGGTGAKPAKEMPVYFIAPIGDVQSKGVSS